jgi:hypothetical protein
MPDMLKDPHHIQQTLANGPVLIARIGEMNILTFTQVLGRAEETAVGAASRPTPEHVVVCRLAMTDQVLAELWTSLSNAKMAASPTAGSA